MADGLANVDKAPETQICIGVLALQGAFREHIAHFTKLPGVTAIEVRKKDDLEDLDGLVIPGGMCILHPVRIAAMAAESTDYAEPLHVTHCTLGALAHSPSLRY